MWKMSLKDENSFTYHGHVQTITFAILEYDKFLARMLTSFPKALRRVGYIIYSNVSVNVCRTNKKTDRSGQSDTRFRCVTP